MTINIDEMNLESFVAVYDTVPEKWEEAREFLVENLKRISNAVNIREIGYFVDEEMLSGKQFFPAPTTIPQENEQVFRGVLRKVIDFGSLPNATVKMVAHEIQFDANFSLIELFASATDPVAFRAIPIPFASPVLNENIKIEMDATNIIITTAINYSAFTRCYVVIEYIQEV